MENKFTMVLQSYKAVYLSHDLRSNYGQGNIWNKK